MIKKSLQNAVEKKKLLPKTMCCARTLSDSLQKSLLGQCLPLTRPLVATAAEHKLVEQADTLENLRTRCNDCQPTCPLHNNVLTRVVHGVKHFLRVLQHGRSCPEREHASPLPPDQRKHSRVTSSVVLHWLTLDTEGVLRDDLGAHRRWVPRRLNVECARQPLKPAVVVSWNSWQLDKARAAQEKRKCTTGSSRVNVENSVDAWPPRPGAYLPHTGKRIPRSLDKTLLTPALTARTGPLLNEERPRSLHLVDRFFAPGAEDRCVDLANCTSADTLALVSNSDECRDARSAWQNTASGRSIPLVRG